MLKMFIKQGCLLLVLLALSTSSAWPSRHYRACVSINEATALVKQQSTGKVLRKSEITRHGKTYYLIRMMTPHGEVKTYWVNKQTGNIVQKP